jgi:FHA domain-containing protein/cysteine-rich secretory family protein
MKIELVLKDRGGSRNIELEDFPSGIGREKHSTVQLQDSRASRHHARIERRGKKLCLVDLGSQNGTQVNGIRSREWFLEPGDEIRIGTSSITVLRVSGDGIAPALSAKEKLGRLSRFPVWQRVATGAFSLLILGGIVAALILPSGKNPSGVVQAPAGPGEAEKALQGLKRLAGLAPQVSQELLDRAEGLKARFHDEDSSGEDPFEDLLVALRTRQKLEVSNRLFKLDEDLGGLLEKERYGEALGLARREVDRLHGEGALSDKEALQRIEGTEGKVRAAVLRLEGEADRLDALERDEECAQLCGKALRILEGTALTARFEERLRFLTARMDAARERKREEEKKLAQAAEKDRAEAGRGTFSLLSGLSALLAPQIRSGALKDKSYSFGGDRGSPVDLKDDLTLVLRDGAREFSISFDAVPAALQLAMAGDALDGEKLLSAVDSGYSAGLRKEADEILWRYVSGAKEDRAQREEKVQKLLAGIRGFSGVPEGGFTYTPGIGWEDLRDRSDRSALVSADRLSKEVLAAAVPESLQKSFEGLLALLDDPKLSTGGRSEVRERAIHALGALRVRLIRNLDVISKKKAFVNLRALKDELKARREAALRTIFDTTIYLPENHPDYPKGEEVNGQRAVDDAVAAVRELWEKPGIAPVALDPSARKVVLMLQAIDERYYEKLYHRPEARDSADLDEVLNNLESRIDLRRYAANRAEAQLFDYNRKVEDYNRDLQDPDITPQEKAHVELLNDYREMLGLRRLFIDPRLCRATRKHSAACSSAGRIWHQGPDGTPDSRARAEGFTGGVAENVAIGYGNPKEIWTRGWYRASDHHRNALGSGHTTIGYGYSGNAGTQNFSSIGAPFR